MEEQSLDKVGGDSSEQSGCQTEKNERITQTNVMDLLEEQEYRCALTCNELTPETASIDHKVPLARGGEHTIRNAQIVDWRVNRAKGTMTNNEFIAMCAEVARFRGQ